MRYWLWHVRKEGDSRDCAYLLPTILNIFEINRIHYTHRHSTLSPLLFAGKSAQNSKRPCRIVCNFQGVEWFMYNRTPAYVALKELLGPGLQDDWTDSGGPLISERTGGWKRGDLEMSGP
ncbi:hypothetical protein BC936DRAFT_141874 [Jimgerdemannia flammicorona]|uniref:Uncharacterized protein n=1 Tax=Jimgerdemannia flammicorona TaxID=994334 RepID=A0A433A1H0_9FUNG|nr:hypothetical protein BC936DRAFT_141874 [Jimgerdemannia flammicorona]